MRVRLCFVAVATAVAAVVVGGWTTSSAVAVQTTCGPSSSEPATAWIDTELRDRFTSYGNDPVPGHWTGGDTTNSVVLPDGRSAWIFSDTFLGEVAADGTRAPWPETPLVNNSMIVEKHGKLGQTLVGGTLAEPAALVAPNDPSHWIWQNDGTVEGDKLRVFLTEWKRTGSGMWDFAWDHNAIATFSLPSLELESVTPAPGQVAGGSVYWGARIMEEGDWTYVYGSEDHSSYKLAHIARVPAGQLLDFDRWEFWTGAAWAPNALLSTPILGGINNEYSVTRIATGYMLVTMDGSVPFGNTIYAYFSCSPTGPWSNQTAIYAAPGVGTRGGIFVYNAHVHPQLSRDGTFLVTYNQNSFSAQDLYDDVEVYRPKFVRFRIPGVEPLP
jgi:hypothetical protein